VASSNTRGYGLVDVLAATALLGIVSATAIPVVAGRLHYERAVTGAQYLGSAIRHARMEALRRNTNVALRFATDAHDTSWQLFVDGDGDGVATRDIEDGIDPPLGPVVRLGDQVREVGLRLNQSVPDIGGGGTLQAGDDPLRIGRTSLLSFSPMGSCTSGTLYVAAPSGPQLAIRIMGATGRTRILRYDAGGGTWLP
jgi:type II secretory pathway pseudopilin PulG